MALKRHVRTRRSAANVSILIKFGLLISAPEMSPRLESGESVGSQLLVGSKFSVSVNRGTEDRFRPTARPPHRNHPVAHPYDETVVAAIAIEHPQLVLNEVLLNCPSMCECVRPLPVVLGGRTLINPSRQGHRVFAPTHPYLMDRSADMPLFVTRCVYRSLIGIRDSFHAAMNTTLHASRSSNNSTLVQVGIQSYFDTDACSLGTAGS